MANENLNPFAAVLVDAQEKMDAHIDKEVLAQYYVYVKCHGGVWRLPKEAWKIVLEKLKAGDTVFLMNHGTKLCSIDHDISTMSAAEAGKLLEKLT